MYGEYKVTEWIQVKIPKELAESLKEELKKHGYVSLSEFIRDAARKRIEEIKEIWGKKENG